MLHKLRALLLLALLVPLFVPASGWAAVAPPAEIRILGVNPADHPNVDLIVHVRDTAGFGVRGLGASDFAVQEGERVVAGEALRVVTSNDAPPAFSLALVLDASTLLGNRALERMRADAAQLAERLLGRRGEQVELALFVPRSGDQRQSASPYTGDREQALADLRAVVPRAGRTDLYNTIAAAVNSSAEQAARRGVPGFVLVLSDG
ncbi:MAG TPA: VWA domain-containing protein, partial [Roseiflexaceae bacterium]|nr:VWA domain-containing protein [Roseiflexaceae bacterium]